MEGDGEPALVPVLDGLGRSDDARAARDQDALAVGRVERDRHHGQHGSREVARQLCDEDRLEEGALVDPLPPRRAGRPDARDRLHRAGRSGGGLRPRGGRRRSGDARRAEEKLLAREPGCQLVLERPDRLFEGGERRLDRVLEELHIRVACACATALGRLRSCIRIPVRLGHGEGTERAGPPLQLLQPKLLAKLRLGRADAGAGPGGGVRRGGLGLEPGHLFGGCGLPAFELGARAGGGLHGLPLGLLADAALERTAHPVVDRLRLGQGSGSVGLLGARQRPGQEQPADEDRDQHHAGPRDDPARERALRGGDPLLPAAHLCASRGANRQLIRLPPIWSHPSPSTWRAM